MKCDRCKREAIIFRRYSGEKLCIKHFLRSIERKVCHELRNPLKGQTKVGLAVSGGKSSLTLAYIVKKCVNKMSKKMELIGLIIDEGISSFREKSIEKAKNFLSNLEIEYHLFRIKDQLNLSVDEIAKKTSEPDRICSYCNILRVRALELLCKEVNINLVLTGHNASDIAQTVLLNIIRGKTKNLLVSTYSSKSIRIEKPLKGILEREIAFYAVLRGIEYYPLSCPYSSHTLRNEISNFLFLLEEKHPGITYSIASFSAKLEKLFADSNKKANIVIS